jgi:hypothetical protein
MSSRAIGFSVSLFPFRIARKRDPFLFGGNAGRIDPGIQVGRKIMMARHFVTLAAFLMEPQPRALAVLEVVLDSKRRSGAHAGEAVNHDADEGAIAESAESGHVDRVQ